ncbi:LysR family transcriptional regulator [Mycobacterium sp. CBMA271]|uniref:LysR substrate-binding domain-containing protein n=1 Tax=unclassified Mycobacteroides TaxID=2618759 RepID=UPI0012DBDA9C|nr:MULTISPECIES: LysR substrate-binding domain-containing protein [unclassified Mycobacteroides]MUM19007.1 LysR family transcriptional regulator [Mycobacteroides sp. CBMA 326]MUM22816.1 LysR family transcriptional regulator [Mycobacteroides sp. CBMA 271]
MTDGDYEWYITLAELQNVTAAAAQLRLAQPTLTRMLARLERRLDVQLFDRHGKRLALNPFGRIFYQHARRAQMELDSARRAIADLANPAEGEIRLGFLHTFGPTLVAGLIASFAETSPHVRFVLEQGAAGSLDDLVANGDLDVAIVSPRPRRPNLSWRNLFRQRLGVAVPIDHRLASAEEVTMFDLADESFVGMHPGFGMRRILEELCAAAQFQPNIVLESSNLTTLAGLVAAGLGITVLPVDGSTYPPELRMLRLVDADAHRDVGIIWSSGQSLSRPVRDFISHAVAST